MSKSKIRKKKKFKGVNSMAGKSLNERYLELSAQINTINAQLRQKQAEIADLQNKGNQLVGSFNLVKELMREQGLSEPNFAGATQQTGEQGSGTYPAASKNTVEKNKVSRIRERLTS